MSNTDDTRDRLERLIAAADRVAAQPVQPSHRRWLPAAAIGAAGLVAVVIVVNAVSGGDRTAVATPTTAVPTVPPSGSQTATSTTLPTVITISPTSSVGTPTTPASGSSLPRPPTGAVVRWAQYQDGTFVLQGRVPDQITASALVMKFSAAAGSANVRDQYVIRAGTERPASEPLYAHDAMQFPDGSAALQSPAIEFLDVLATLLLQNPGVTVDIDAFTDDQQPADQAMALTQARADAVADRLVARGVARERLVATGHGAAEPLADNADEAGRAANRRVDFVLHDLLATD